MESDNYKQLNIISGDSVICNLIGELNNAGNYNDIITLLLSFNKKNTEATSNIRAGMFLFRNYYIMPAGLGKSMRFIDNMKFLKMNAYCPTAAPEFIGMPISKDGKSCVIITRINNSEGGDLLPYYCNTTNETKKKIFANELITLLNEESLYNPLVLNESYKSWYLTPKEKNIIFDDWSTLLKCGYENEKKEIRAELQKIYTTP